MIAAVCALSKEVCRFSLHFLRSCFHSKTNNFEGGVRLAAFINGGFLPDELRGGVREGFTHMADVYPTLCGLAGIEASDPNPAAPEVPNLDGLDMWPFISGKNTTSPRTEMMLSSEDNGAIISGDWKLILGEQTYGFWQAPVYPNASTNHKLERPFDCGSGCLFNIRDDPSEYHDQAEAMPEKLAEMQALWRTRNATKYYPERVPVDGTACAAAAAQRGGFLGPYLHLNDGGNDRSDFRTSPAPPPSRK